jgi:hypothetical protein
MCGSVAMSTRWTGRQDWNSNCKSGRIDGSMMREATNADGGDAGIGRGRSIIIIECICDPRHTSINTTAITIRLVVRPALGRAGR